VKQESVISVSAQKWVLSGIYAAFQRVRSSLKIALVVSRGCYNHIGKAVIQNGHGEIGQEERCLFKAVKRCKAAQMRLKNMSSA
jgi:hypothetical protein